MQLLRRNLVNVLTWGSVRHAIARAHPFLAPTEQYGGAPVLVRAHSMTATARAFSGCSLDL